MRSSSFVICTVVFVLMLFGGCGDDAVSPPADNTVTTTVNVFSFDRIGTTFSDVWAFSSDRSFVLTGRAVIDFDGDDVLLMETGSDATLVDVWASSAGDAFVGGIAPGGAAAEILHYDGKSWTSMSHPLTGFLTDIFGSAPNDVYAVAANGGVARYDGESWELFRPPGSMTYNGWAGGSNDVYLVGLHGLILHYDGSSWNSTTIEDVPLIAAAGIGDGKLLAVSSSGVYHVEGQDWQEKFNAQATITSIARVDSNDVYIAGSGGTIVHYDGIEWSPVQVTGLTNRLNGISMSSSDHAIAVGEGGAVAVLEGISWNGTQGMKSEEWGSVLCVEGDVIAGSTGGRVIRNDGSGWIDAVPPDPTRHVFDMWSNTPNAVWVVARKDGDSQVVLWDGSRWDVLPAPTDAKAVWGSATGSVFVVGLGEVYEFSYDNPFAPPGIHTPVAEQLHDVWGAPNDDVFAVGDGGVVVRYRDRDWAVLRQSTDQRLHGVWGTSSSDIVVVGDGGLILRFNGSDWSTEVSDTPIDLSSVWGSGPDDYWAVGKRGVIRHFDGDRWQRVRFELQIDLLCVAGDCSGDVYVAGDEDCLFRYGRR